MYLIAVVDSGRWDSTDLYTQASVNHQLLELGGLSEKEAVELIDSVASCLTFFACLT